MFTRTTRSLFLAALVLILSLSPARAQTTAFPFKKDDRVAWVGSSSTKIGVWPKTMEFLLRTRHPELKLDFKLFSTGGGTFATGLQNIDKWLGDYKATLVFVNYGGNDAGGGEKGLPQFKDNMEKLAAKIQGTGARLVFMPPQAADVRRSGEPSAARRSLYAQMLLKFAADKNWPAVDIHYPLDRLQKSAQKDDDKYTILSDSIHLTPPAYIAWAYFLYEGLNPPAVESSAELAADGKVVGTSRCKISDVKATRDGLTFTRLDEVLPILPPVALPPHKYVPLEKLSVYRLKVSGLDAGKYEILGEGKVLGTVDAAALAKGVNLNTFAFDQKVIFPWDGLAKQLWTGKDVPSIGNAAFQFEVRRVNGGKK